MNDSKISLAGLAWGGAEIVSVEVTIDGGRTWQAAIVEHGSGRWAWRRRHTDIDLGLPRGLRVLSARATDAFGRVQEWRSKPNRLGYANNGIHSVIVDLALSST